MAIYHEDLADIELTGGNIHRSFMNHTIGSGDAMANRFGVRLFRDGEAVSAEDCAVTGLFVAPNGTAYAITETNYEGSTGTDGNRAWVQLPGICYAEDGPFTLAIKLTGGTVEGTMRIVDGMVCNTGEAGAVVPTSTIPTTAEIIAAYEEAVAVIAGSVRFNAAQSLSTAEKKTARGNIGTVSANDIAPEFSTGTSYTAGQYVTYNSVLYMFLTAHSGEWSASDVIAVNVGGRLTLAENAMRSADVPLTWNNGKYLDDTGHARDSDNYSYCNYVEIPPMATAIVRAFFGGNARMVVYDAGKNIDEVYSNSVSYTSYDLVLSPSKETRYVRVSSYQSYKQWAFARILVLPQTIVKSMGDRVEENNKYLADCDDAEQNSIYTITTDVDNTPNGETGTLISLNGASNTGLNGCVQIFVTKTGEMYTRMHWGSSGGTWRAWQQISFGATNEDYSGIAMFERFGVIGDSFASGTVYTPGVTSDREYYPLSWGQILARQEGNVCVNYAKGGYNTYAFVNPEDANYNTRGLGKVLSDIGGDNACGLYLLCLGINDSNNTRTYGDKTGGLDYLGTSADIKEDPAQNENSFWGNYGRIISAIQTASPASRIVLCTFKRNPTTATQEGYEPFRSAIADIADHFNLPCIKLDDDPFFNSSFYMSNMVGSHPTAPQYTGYAKGINRLLSKVIVDNYDYFKEYIGVN